MLLHGFSFLPSLMWSIAIFLKNNFSVFIWNCKIESILKLKLRLSCKDSVLLHFSLRQWSEKEVFSPYNPNILSSNSWIKSVISHYFTSFSIQNSSTQPFSQHLLRITYKCFCQVLLQLAMPSSTTCHMQVVTIILVLLTSSVRNCSSFLIKCKVFCCFFPY